MESPTSPSHLTPKFISTSSIIIHLFFVDLLLILQQASQLTTPRTFRISNNNWTSSLVTVASQSNPSFHERRPSTYCFRLPTSHLEWRIWVKAIMAPSKKEEKNQSSINIEEIDESKNVVATYHHYGSGEKNVSISVCLHVSLLLLYCVFLSRYWVMNHF